MTVERPANDFQSGMRKLAGGVCVISAVTAQGERCGLTATAVCSLTLEPPTLVACVNKQTRLGSAVREAPAFAVNILSTSQLPVARAFAGMVPGVRGTARFAYGRWEEGAMGAPVLADSPASFVCTLDDAVDRSTHLLLLGGAVDIRTTRQETEPLLYVNRQFHSPR